MNIRNFLKEVKVLYFLITSLPQPVTNKEKVWSRKKNEQNHLFNSSIRPLFNTASPKYRLHKLISAKVEVIERISPTLWSLFH